MVLLAAEIDQQHTAPVHGELGLVGQLEAAHRPEVRAKELGVDDVFAVERQRQPGETAAEGADRHAVDLRVLRAVLANDEGLVAGNGRRVAHRQRAQLSGRVQVALEEHRRGAEQIGDVVEAVARFVRRQQRHGIDLEVEQVLDRVGVLRPVHPVHHRTAHVGLGRGGAIERRLHRGDEAVRGGVIRPRHAGRRHHAHSHLANDLLEQVALLEEIAGGVRGVEAFERQPPGLRTLVVTGDAVLLQQSAMVWSRRGSRGRARFGGRAHGRRGRSGSLRLRAQRRPPGGGEIERHRCRHPFPRQHSATSSSWKLKSRRILATRLRPVFAQIRGAKMGLTPHRSTPCRTICSATPSPRLHGRACDRSSARWPWRSSPRGTCIRTSRRCRPG